MQVRESEAAAQPGASARELLVKALPLVRPYGARFARVLTLALAAAVLSAVEPLIMKRLFDELDADRIPGRLLSALVALLGVAVVRDVLGAFRDAGAGRVRTGVHYAFTRATVEGIHALPLSYHRRESVGAVMAKMDRGINGAINAFSDVAFNLLPSIFYLLFALVAMSQLDLRLSLVVILFLPLPPLIGAWVAREQTHRDKLLMDRWSSLFSRLNEVLSGMLLVKSCAMEDEEKRRFLDGVEGANDVAVRGGNKDAGSNAAKSIAMTLARAGALGLGTWFILRGEMTVGTLIAFLTYAGGVFGPVQGITGAYQRYRVGLVSLETVLSIVDSPDNVAEPADAKVADHLRGEVEFKGVDFAYPDSGPVLRDVSLRAGAGETIAIVGESGSGKTTAMQLLQGLYDPSSGNVKIDGVDVREYEQRSLRRQIGTVMQDAELFNDTIRENIAFGSPDATDQEVERAARTANVHDSIVAMPDGYATKVGERGNRLSAGQRQHIALARALLRDPAILILEETSHTSDAQSESLLDERLALRGRTTFVIAHRLTTAARADRIVAFKRGRIVEEGDHDELLARGSYYRSLVRSQWGDLL